MFPINWNDPLRKKDGTLGTIEDLGEGGGGGGGTTIYHGNTLPDASLGNEGDIYLYMSDSMAVDFTLTITKALRADAEQNYCGAQEIQLFFTDGTTSKNIIQFPEFHCEANGGGISSAFDGDTGGQYWEKNGLPAIVKFGANIPTGCNIEKLVVWQRNSAQYLDVWKDFTLAMNNVIILSEANLTQSDWEGVGQGTTFDDFDSTSLTMIGKTYYKVKIDNVVQWIS